MAEWTRRTFLILKSFSGSKWALGLLVALGVTGSALVLLFESLEAQQSKSVTSVIGSQLRNESSMSRSYLLAQSLEDLVTTGAIKCASLARTGADGRSVFYDSTFRDHCPRGSLKAVIFRGIDGHDWEFKLAPHIPVSFYVIKWTTILSVALLLIFSFVVLYEFIGRERRRRKLLEELTSQVRHDVASPISALRVIADRAPLDSEMKDFLSSAVARTEAIFRSLSREGGAGSCWINQELQRVVSEKRMSSPTFARLTVQVEPLLVEVPSVEFGRMISNLLNNAQEAGATDIEIVGQSSNGQVEISIRDNGRPFPKEIHGKLGERGASFGKQGGSGLGLWHAVRLMRESNGELRISDQPKQVLLKWALHIRGSHRSSI